MHVLSCMSIIISESCLLAIHLLCVETELIFVVMYPATLLNLFISSMSRFFRIFYIQYILYQSIICKYTFASSFFIWMPFSFPIALARLFSTLLYLSSSLCFCRNLSISYKLSDSSSQIKVFPYVPSFICIFRNLGLLFFLASLAKRMSILLSC